MLLRTKKAQSTLEYILILTAIIGVIIYAAAQLVRPRVQQSYTDIKTSITSSADAIGVTTTTPE